MKNSIYIALLSLLFISCDSNERSIKKTFSRLNSHEISSASKYIWPEDYKNLYTFNQRFLSQNDLTSLDIEIVNPIEIAGNTAYSLTLNCSNCNDELLAYFKAKNNLVANKIVDTMYIKSSNGNDYLTFDWGLNDKYISDNIKLSNVLAKRLNLRSGPGKNFRVVGQLDNGDELLIDGSYENSSWRKGIVFDESSKVNSVYFSSKLSDRKEINFFTLNWVNSLGILMLTIIALLVLFVVYPLLFAALFRAGGAGAGTFALILFFVLLIAIYFTYQIVESAVFELFIINLPY
jgi:uncharacterized protein YgiM (DUF1202 family)